jgi:hypothetical protein
MELGPPQLQLFVGLLVILSAVCATAVVEWVRAQNDIRETSVKPHLVRNRPVAAPLASKERRPPAPEALAVMAEAQHRATVARTAEAVPEPAVSPVTMVARVTEIRPAAFSSKRDWGAILAKGQQNAGIKNPAGHVRGFVIAIQPGRPPKPAPLVHEVSAQAVLL